MVSGRLVSSIWFRIEIGRILILPISILMRKYYLECTGIGLGRCSYIMDGLTRLDR
ncbi:hypothetical protein SBF1_2070008 [Candidatus Desulfosporosinus infrequens]|uniref:Uncharacterized protein n=1 Tax=Candidatus Desulfosporosinus infrequens TaxID=2043169 RepID=A0A2U3KIF6_9FIRM|nr:hypothetical protein SBF1_2070008 [Candidatus Desulfosporosinus infrequens]